MKKDRSGISAENVYFWIGADSGYFSSVSPLCGSYLLLLLFTTCPLVWFHHLF